MYEYVIRPPPPQTKNPPLFGWRKGKEKNWWGLNIFSCDLSKYFLSKIKRKPSESHLITRWRKCSMQLDMGLSNDSNPLLFSFSFFSFFGSGLVCTCLFPSFFFLFLWFGRCLLLSFSFLFAWAGFSSSCSSSSSFFLFFFAFFCDFFSIYDFYFLINLGDCFCFNRASFLTRIYE